MSKKVTIVHSPDYANWFFSEDHPTQGRRFINGFNQMKKSFRVLEPRLATISELTRVHSVGYVKEVINDHTCFEWGGAREDLSRFAQLFAGGTLVALEALLKKDADVAIHLPGAKHHAQYDHSSGFCVFNDFALAADIATKDHGLKVAIIDIDAHHGDGVENLTRDNPDVLTFSIHESGIFPGTGNEDQLELNVFNFPLTTELGKGDKALLAGVNKFIPIARTFQPDLLFITSGADGLSEDPLTQLQYTVEGYADAAALIRKSFPRTPILMGGAGGYLPDDGTPAVWAAVAEQLAA
ncbi:AcuC Deacetylases, including yeast histone deacetylase and acetoin utilization protein [Candidatus Nanopelagicaceae bacterium]